MARPKTEQTLRDLRPSFKLRAALAVVLLVTVTLSVAGIAVWGVIRIHEDSTIALHGYRQLREVYEVGVYVAQARQTERGDSQRQIDLAISRLDLFALTGDGWLDQSKSVEIELRQALSQAGSVSNERSRADALDLALSKLATLAAQVRASVEEHQAAAAHERKITILLIAIFSGGFVLLATIIGFLHYRSVMRPIDRLALGVRKFAAGELDARIDSGGDREFSQLARDLNHMAGELKALHHDLELKVEQKSRELVQSERLASVGYLAAGVAHEINNPLSIIAAYAERAFQRLRREPIASGASENVEQALRIVCEEAFRCKEITDRLLSMARSGDENRQLISLAALAQEVVTMVGGLPQFAHAQVTLQCDGDRDKLVAVVNDAEIKQVLLNLLVNACEATTGPDGRVRVVVRPSKDETVEIVVQDNGHGMEQDTLQRAFEPFFTAKSSQRSGTGLGLSICHAIIQSHGGRLAASSDGVGKGSAFTITLPAARESKLASA